MRVTYDFNLPEDNEELEIFAHARETYSCMEDVKQFIRGQLKHGIEMEGEELLLTIRNMLPDVGI